MIQFFAPGLPDDLMLPEEEAAHCTRVLRKNAGDAVYAVDGRGTRYNCVIESATKNKVSLEIVDSEKIPCHWGCRITLAIAPTKNADRMEWLVEKAVEMGVDRVILLKCDHSERKEMKTGRLERIMVSAMKQSLKAQLPAIEGPVPFTRFIDECTASSSFRFVAHCEKDKPRRLFARELQQVCGSIHGNGAGEIVLLIGPEGDFSPEEIEKAIAGGFVPVSFGESRLRTETAALFGLCSIHDALQRTV